jgi:hypothetical protein
VDLPDVEVIGAEPPQRYRLGVRVLLRIGEVMATDGERGNL